MRRTRKGAARAVNAVLNTVKLDSPTKWGVAGAAVVGTAAAVSQIWEGPANLFTLAVGAVADSPEWVIAAATAVVASAAAFALADTTTAAVQTCGPKACQKEIVKQSEVDRNAYSPLLDLDRDQAIKARWKNARTACLESIKPNTPTKMGILASMLAGAGVGLSAISNIPLHAYQEAWAMLVNANITQVGNQTVITFANQTMSHTAVWVFSSMASASAAFEILALTAFVFITCGPKGCRKEYIDRRPDLLLEGATFSSSLNNQNANRFAAPQGQPDVPTSDDGELPQTRGLGLGSEEEV